ncbi:uncharacterized protein LOC123522920 [Mercenaria mercenaria]|uniref:uncharacterized protein LOC123522920 n=1 Tax=Mercenaria mercenaria TaxID=6596 RepID=UPI00234FB528|nr:uncharacterized protein LOC123522920 [Mercenaria mercenaria]
MAAPLNQSNNVCLQARDIGRKIRHSADLSVSDTDLVQYIDTLINLLSDQKYLSTDQNAQQAVVKLKNLKANKLAITTEDITNVIDDAIRQSIKSQGDIALQAVSTTRDEALVEIEDKKCKSLQLLKDIKSSLANVQTVTAESLDRIIAEKLSAIHNIKIVAENEKRELKSIGSSERALLQEELQKNRDRKQRSAGLPIIGYFRKRGLRKSIKKDLISFYEECYSYIPVAPLAEDHDALLTDFYVEPPLTSVDVQRKFRSRKQLSSKMPIHSYSDLFIRRDGKMYKHIYVTAKAGVGKTSFAKKVCKTWCQAHSPNKEIKHKFKKADLDAMKKFEFLFMISLRDVETSECDLESMITSSLLNCLKSHSRYSRLDIEDILNEKTCLLLLDGLDEWAHPTSCDKGCRDVHAIPHIPAREQCTVMTTIRPWKFEVVKLGTSQIDRHVEINELNDSASKELISNAVTVLNTQTQSN